VRLLGASPKPAKDTDRRTASQPFETVQEAAGLAADLIRPLCKVCGTASTGAPCGHALSETQKARKARKLVERTGIAGEVLLIFLIQHIIYYF
jgi:hypothetical protein